MSEIINSMFTAPLATLFIIGGMVFLLIAVLGNISGKIEPGPKARIASGVLGLAFILAGSLMYVWQGAQIDKQGPMPSINTTTTRDAYKAPSSPISDSLRENSGLGPDPKSSKIPKEEPKKEPGIPTKYKNVVAGLQRFEKTDGFVTMELSVRNTSSEKFMICGTPQARLIDAETGESWNASFYGGYGKYGCEWLAPGPSGGAWMKFKVPDPEKRKFSLAWDFLTFPLENLVLSR